MNKNRKKIIQIGKQKQTKDEKLHKNLKKSKYLKKYLKKSKKKIEISNTISQVNYPSREWTKTGETIFLVILYTLIQSIDIIHIYDVNSLIWLYDVVPTNFFQPHLAQCYSRSLVE